MNGVFVGVRSGLATFAFIASGCWFTVWPAAAQRVDKLVPSVPSPLVVTADQPFAYAVELALDAQQYAAVKAQAQLLLRRFRASPDATLDLELAAVDVFAADARIVLGTANGDVPIAHPDVSLFRGRVVGDDSSTVFLGFSPHGSNGFILTTGKQFLVSSRSVRGRVRTLAFDLAAVPANAINIAPWTCGTDLLPIPPDRQDWFEKAVPSTVATASTQGVTRSATLAIETDWEYTSALFGGDLGASGAYAATLIGAVSEIYIEQVDTQIEIGFLRLWSDAADPWTAGSTGDQLTQLRSHWQSQMGGVSRDAVHMLSGRGLGGGVAYLGGLCSGSFGYAVSANLNGGFPYPLQDNSSQNWDIYVTSHELGHNFGAPHTHSVSPPIDGCGQGNCSVTPNGTIMSYCHQCPGGYTNILLEFHQRMKDEYILPFLNFEVTCNLSAEPVDCGTVEAPTTHALGAMNRAIAIVGGNPGERSAVRITYDSVPPPNEHLTGTVVWMTVPERRSEHSASLDPSDAPAGWPTFDAAGVACTPSYIDWSLFGAAYVQHPSIVPGAQFTVDAILLGCDQGVAANFSAPLAVSTSVPGDVVGNCQVTPCTPANGFAENVDITAVLDKFKNLPSAPSKARADLDPATLDGRITISDVLRTLDGFVGDPYLYLAPNPCP